VAAVPLQVVVVVVGQQQQAAVVAVPRPAVQLRGNLVA